MQRKILSFFLCIFSNIWGVRATCVVVDEEGQVDGKGKAEGEKYKENCQASRLACPARVSIQCMKN